jgi:hypothetical protein
MRATNVRVMDEYRDTLFGIPVVIHKAAVETTDEDGEKWVTIPDEKGLAVAVALARVFLAVRLQAPEIVMLRKTLRMRQGEFAEKLSIDQGRLSRLEKDTQGLGHYTEMQTRLYVASRLVKLAPAISCDLGELATMKSAAVPLEGQLPELHFERVVLKSAETHTKSDQWDIATRQAA